MKKITILMLAGALALAGCSSKQDSSITDSQKAAIQSVLTQRDKIEKEYIASLSSERVAGLMAIDARGCPDDFRSAWFDYLAKVHELHIRAERVAIIGLAAGKPVSDLPGLIKFAAGNPGAGEYLLTAVSKVDDAWANVERAGMNDGVMPAIEIDDAGHQTNAAPEPAK